MVERLNDLPKVAVIGAGIVGASVAYRLVQGGATVTLIDRGQPGEGTTSRSFAWLNANRKTPRAYFDLNVAGMREHRALANELPPGDWLHNVGNVVWSEDSEIGELRERVDRLRSWGYAAEWRDAAAVRSALEPNFATADPTREVAFFPDEGWVDVPHLTACLIEAAERLGLTMRTDMAVTGVGNSGGQINTLILGGGERLEVDAVVNAAGTGAAEVSRLAGAPLPMAPTRGLLVRLSTQGNLIHRLMHTPAVNFRPDSRGRVLLHHDSFDARLGDREDVATIDPLVHEMVAEAVAVVPALAGAPIFDARIGVRPITADGYPSAGGLPELGGYYEAVTHSGVTLGPLLGRLIASEVLTGKADPLLATFRPERFHRSR